VKIESALVGFIAIAMMAVPLALASTAVAQTAADHEALAHGKPIVNGHPVQPTPDVVQERWRHHEMMLQSEAAEAKGKSSSSSPAVPEAVPKVDAPAAEGTR
jgi:hypothetical protein